MGICVPIINDAQLDAVVTDIDRTGFAVLPDFVARDQLARMRSFVAAAVAGAGGEYAGFTGPGTVCGSGLDDLAHSAPFRSIVERIYQRGTGRTPPGQEFYQVLRCLTGESARVHSYLFHYDSYVLTLLIPIEVPAKGMAGDFLMLPNTRRIRKHYLRNALDKVILDNRVTQWLLRSLTASGAIKLTRIKMVPGHAYVFWGYRSIHTNEPCDPDQVRATALFHYANPHARTLADKAATILPAAANSGAEGSRQAA